MPTQLEIYQFWSDNTKRRCFARLRIYPRLKKQHNSEVISKREIASEFRVKWLIKVYFDAWKQNILEPCAVLKADALNISRNKLMSRMLFRWRLAYVRVGELCELLEERLAQVELASKLAVFAKWRLATRNLRCQRCLEVLITSEQHRLLKSVFERMIQAANMVTLTNQRGTELKLISSAAMLFKAYKTWKICFKSKQETQELITEAISFHHTVIRPLGAAIVLKKALHRAENEENCAAEQAAQRAKAEYIGSERERRNELYQLAIEAQNQFPRQDLQTNGVAFEVSRIREPPVLPPCMESNYDEIQNSLVKEREDLILKQISSYKQTEAAAESLAERLEEEQEKLYQLEGRLDNTTHPWSCKLEIETQQEVISRCERELQRVEQQRDTLRHGLREVRDTI